MSSNSNNTTSNNSHPKKRAASRRGNTSSSSLRIAQLKRGSGSTENASYRPSQGQGQGQGQASPSRSRPTAGSATATDISEDSDPFNIDDMMKSAESGETNLKSTNKKSSTSTTSTGYTAGGANSNTNDDVFEDALQPPSRFSRGISGYSTGTARISDGSIGSTMLADMAGRDPRKVDQSVNIMAGQYGSGSAAENDFTTSKNKRANRTKKRMSYMEIFFDSGPTKVHRKSMMAIDLGPDPTKKPRKSIFQSLGISNHSNGDALALVEEPVSMKIQDCCSNFCQCTWTVLCSIWFLMIVAIVATCLLFLPKNTGTESVASSSSDNTALRTPAPITPTVPAVAPLPTVVPPEEPETVEERATALKDYMVGVIPTTTQNDWDDPESKPSLAIQWLAEFDPLQLSILDTPKEQLVQRYALATFFFATNDDLQPQDLSESEPAKTQLRRFLQPLAQDESALVRGQWMSSNSVCDWEGMRCDKNQQLVEFNRTRAGLVGNIPRELLALSHLTFLDLSHNLFHGTIPTTTSSSGSGTHHQEANSLTNLRYLLLHDNALTGTLPESIAKMTALYDLDLSSNQLEGELPLLENLSNLRLFMVDQNKLTGTISPGIRSMEHLEFLYLGDNELEGELPFEIFSHLKELVDLRLENNGGITGTVPPEIESLHRLEYIKMGKNSLGGQLPDVFDRLHYLVELDVHKNSFVGTLPASLGTITTLERLNFAHNNFEGPIPTEWGNLPNLVSLMAHVNDLDAQLSFATGGDGLMKLKDLWLNNNTLTGQITDGLGRLTSLVDVFLENNEFEGTLPSSLGDLTELAALKVYNTKLSGTVPFSICSLRTTHELSYLATDCLEKVVCECCDKCL